MNDSQSLIFVKQVAWTEAFAFWEKGEAELPHWIEHYKSRGFNSWSEWRKSSIKHLHPERLKWNLFEVMDPQKTICNFYGGPFRAWINKYYGNKETLQFKELASNSTLQDDSNINEIIEKFPEEVILIGVIRDGKIIIIEGMHRCCAIAVAYLKEISLNPKTSIVLAEFIGNLPILGQPNSPT